MFRTDNSFKNIKFALIFQLCTLGDGLHFRGNGGAPAGMGDAGGADEGGAFLGHPGGTDLRVLRLLYAENGGFFQIYPAKQIPEYDVGQNFQMLLPFLFRHKCPTIPEPLYQVYVRPDSHSRQMRSEAGEARRYRLFEELTDEILEICGLTDNRAAVERTACWKAGRQAGLARRYRHTGRFFRYKSAAVRFRLKGLLRRDKS